MRLVAVGYGANVELKRLEGDFLREQNIAARKATFWHEAPSVDAHSTGVKLIDVHRIAMIDAVAVTGLAADHVEVPALVMLLALFHREVLAQQFDGALARRLVIEDGKKSAKQ